MKKAQFLIQSTWSIFVLAGFAVAITWPNGTHARLDEFAMPLGLSLPVFPGWRGMAAGWGQSLLAVLFALFAAFAARGTGRRLGASFSLPRNERVWLEPVAGGVLLGIWYLGLGLAGLFFRPLLLASLLPGLWWSGGLRRGTEGTPGSPLPGWLRWFMVVAAVFWVLAVLVPEPGIDAYLYHLRLPFYYVLHHKIFSVWHHIHGHVPQLWEIILGAFPGELSATAAQALSALCVLPLWRMLSRREDSGWGVRAASLLLLSSPLVVGVGASAYTDLPLMWLGFGAFVLLAGGGEPTAARRFAAGAVLGAACSLKYAAFPAVAAALAWVAVESIRRRSAGWGLPGLAGFTLVFWPWPAWNALATGNPVFPFLGRMFPDSLPALPFAERLSSAVFRRTIPVLLAGPWNAFVACEPFLYLSPWFVCAFPALFAALKTRSLGRGTGLWLAVYFLSWSVFMADERFALAAIPIMALAVPFPSRGRAWALALGALFLLNFAGTVRQCLLPLQRVWAATGLMERASYLAKTLAPSPGFMESAGWLNGNTGKGDRILMVSDYKSHYIWRECIHDHVYDYPSRLNYILWSASPDPARIAARFRQLGISWVLYLPTVNQSRLGQIPDLFPFKPADARAFGGFWSRHAQVAAMFPGASIYHVSWRASSPHDLPELPGIQDVVFAELGVTGGEGAVGKLRRLVAAYPHNYSFRRALDDALMTGRAE